jgi:hypothetical protein
MKKLLIISYSNLDTDPRVLRHVEALKDQYELHMAGLRSLGQGIAFIKLEREGKRIEQNIEFHLNFPLLIRKLFSVAIRLWILVRRQLESILDKIHRMNRVVYWEKKYWSVEREQNFAKLSENQYDLILANDIETLPLALRLKQKHTQVVLDSHEYHPRELEEDFHWVKEEKPLVEYLCSTYLSKTDMMFTVCEGIAMEFQKQYGVLPIVLTNASSFRPIVPGVVQNNKIRLIHHGNASPSRQIESMMEMTEQLDDRFSLDLMLVPQEKMYYESIVEKASKMKRVRVIAPVPTMQIIDWINQYDMGVYILPPVNFNSEYALPNKIFEFIQARLGLAIGPSPEMAALVRKYDLGVVSANFEPESLAEELLRLTTERVTYFKSQSHLHAMELSAEGNTALLRRELNKLMNKSQ